MDRRPAASAPDPATPDEPGEPARSRRLSALGLFSLLALAICLIPLAAPGAELIPAAAGDLPGWIAGPYGSGLGVEPGAYLAALYLALLAYVGVVIAAPRLGGRILWVAIVVAVAAFALAPPLLSLDVFSYISYGRLQIEGLDPYAVGPAALPLDEAARRVEDFRDAPSVYGPLFTLVSAPVAALGVPAALWSFKALAAAAALALAALCAWVAGRRGGEPLRAAALVGLNPIVLVHGVGGAHNDVLMALGMVACAALVVAARPLAAGATIVAASAVKLAAAIIAPFALLGAGGRRERTRFAAGVAGALAAALVLAYLLWGGDAVSALDVLGGQERVSRYSVPGTVARIAGVDPDPVRAVAAAGFALAFAWLCLWVHRGADWLRAAGWAALALLVASAYMTPWYAVWALPLAAISNDRALVAATLAFCALQLVNAIPL